MRGLLAAPTGLGLLAVGYVLWATAPAHTQQPNLEQRFQQLDRNGDGKLSAQELQAPRVFGQMDADGDGFVTLEEVRQGLSARRAQSDAPTAPPATVPEDADVNAKPAPPPAEPPVSPSRAFTGLTFSKDYEAGTKDARGQLMGGTETMRLLHHAGRLFASTGAWMDLPYEPRPADQPAWTGPQILVKESAAAPWRVDVSFPKAVRVDAMVSATFVTDGSGRKLDLPVSLLVASPSSENTATWTRDDATGEWTESLAVEGLLGGLRSFYTHLDKVTGIQYLFGGSTRSGSIFRAVYDPAAPGKLRWHRDPELSGTGRMMCMAEANGVLYAAGGIKDETPLSGGLFRRVDGEKPRWELLWRWPHEIRARGDETEILRGLTPIPDPKGGTHEVLLGTCNFPGVVYRIDPAAHHAVTTELDIRAYFAKAFGVAKLSGPCLSAYNNFLPVTDPDTGEKVLLLGLWINHPDGRTTENGLSAWYLVRHADGTYGHGRIFDPKHPRPNPPRGLLATRTIEVSPFPEDKGRVLYFGGFDCAAIESRNTAWIYKGTLPPSLTIGNQPLPELRFTQDYVPGVRDVNGRWMGGTEALNLAVHKNRLYAGIGYWQDIPHYEDKAGDPWVGAQILVKEAKDAPWKVDLNMGERILRARALRSVVLETDSEGHRLPQPVAILLASGMNFGSPEILVWSRDDEANQWHKVIVDRTKVGDYLVAFGGHRDQVTGVSHVFGGSRNGSVYKGVFDPAAPGKIRWEDQPEFTTRDERDDTRNAERRVMGFAEADGHLYASIRTSIYRRTDGAQPGWQEVYRWPLPPPKQGGFRRPEGRGLTAVRKPDGKGQMLLVALEMEQVVRRLDPANEHRTEDDFDVGAYFLKAWGHEVRSSLCMAHNRMVPYTIAATGEQVLMFGFIANPRGAPSWNRSGGAGLFIRRADGTYYHFPVEDPSLGPHPLLYATRDVAPSPWEPNVIYACGYDATGNAALETRAVNTAWIYRGELPASELRAPTRKNP